MGSREHEVSHYEGVSLTETLHDYAFNFRIWALVCLGGGAKKMGICVRLDMVREFGQLCNWVCHIFGRTD